MSEALLESLSPEALYVCDLLWSNAYQLVLAEVAEELAGKGLARIGELEVTQNGRLYRGVIRTFLPGGTRRSR